MTADETRAVMMAYWQGDHTLIAADAEYTDLALGRTERGRDAISAWIDEFYGTTFSGTLENMRSFFGDGHALLEGHLVGTQNLPYAGIEPGERTVRVPLAIVYDLKDGQIVQARIYLIAEALRR
jgi:hypothetical protein